MKLEQAARQALDFCEELATLGGKYPYVNETQVVVDARKTSFALREALAEQAEQEPVACPDKGLWTVKQWGTDKVVLLSGDFTHDVALAISGDFLDSEQRLDYALNLASWMNHHLQNAAPVRQAEREPVVKIHKYNEFQTLGSLNLPIDTKLYAAPVRTKDLTDDEILEITKRFALGIAFPVDGVTTPEMFARAVIAADREKNK